MTYAAELRKRPPMRGGLRSLREARHETRRVPLLLHSRRDAIPQLGVAAQLPERPDDLVFGIGF
jgi:hypothetical protein